MLIAVVIFSTTIDLSENTKKAPLPNFIPLLFVFLLLIYMLYRVFKTSPQIEIWDDKLKIYGIFHKKKELTINEILEIDLLSIGMFNGNATIVTKIKFVTGEVFQLASPNYKNISEIKLKLLHNFPEKIKKRLSSKSMTPIEQNEELKFSGNPYTSFNGFLIYGILIGFTLMIFTSKKDYEPIHLFLIFPILVLPLGLAYQLHYLIFSGEILIVKNHFLPWINKQYNIKDIIGINFEHHFRTSQSLRITTKDYKSRNFPAGSLRDKHWEGLKEYAKSRGIFFIG